MATAQAFRPGLFEELDRPALVSNAVCFGLGLLLLALVLRTPARPFEATSIDQLPRRVARLILSESELTQVTAPAVVPRAERRSEEAQPPAVKTTRVSPSTEAVGVPETAPEPSSEPGSPGGGGGHGAGGRGAAMAASATRAVA